MRELKFRGKRNDNNEWAYGSLIVDTDKKCYSIIDYALTETNTYTWHDVIIGSVGQFTGLKDKNSKEIYEGDIIKVGRDIGIRKVVWSEDVACYEALSNIGSRSLYGYLNDGIEIIGNIYENPELLKESTNARQV